MDFVDNVDFVFAFDGGVTNLIDEVADLLDAIVTGGVDFNDIWMGARVHGQTVGAMVALVAKALLAV